MTIAITRKVSPRFDECELTHIERVPINLDIARAQHSAYVQALASLGCQVIELPEEADLPDSVFVEDAAVVLREVAVVTRPGAESRRAETESIIHALSPYRPLVYVTEPATVDGGDVLVLDRHIYVGMSTRSNNDAIMQLQELLDTYGYMVSGVPLRDCLHLKSAISRVDNSTLLINKDWVDPTYFADFNLIEVDVSEPYASNCLPIGDSIIYPTAFPKTSAKLERQGHSITRVDVSELAKAEGAVTCCSLILE